MGYKQSVLQRRLCTNSPSAHLRWRVQGDASDPLVPQHPSHHLHYLSSKMLLIFKVVCSTAPAYIMALLFYTQELCGSDWVQISIGADKPPLVPLPLPCQQVAWPNSSRVKEWSPQILFLGPIMLSLDEQPFSLCGQVVLAQPQLLQCFPTKTYGVSRLIQYQGEMPR